MSAEAEPTKPLMRAAIYLRVSTSKQAEKDLSIPDQRNSIRGFCEERGWTVVREFVEPGVSGMSERRPAFQEMIAAARTRPKPFDIVVVHSYSRFFRDLYYLEFYRRRLLKSGIQLFSISQQQELGEENSTVVIARYAHAMADELNSRENSKHVFRTQRLNAKQGFWNGSQAPLGYRSVAVEKRGDRAKKRLEIDPAEAAIIRRAYDLVHTGMGSGPLGIAAVAHLFNSTGVTNRGRPFSVGALHKMLTREAYVGRYWWGRHTKHGIPKPQEEHVLIQIPPIIDEAKFLAVKAQLASRNPRKIPPRVVSSPVLLTGIAVCSNCGGHLMLSTGKAGRYRYYACGVRQRQGPARCSGRRISMPLLDQLVVDQLSARLFTRARLEEILSKTIEATRRDGGSRKREIKTIAYALRDTEKRIRNLYDMVERGITPLTATLKDRLSELSQLREEQIRLKSDAEEKSAVRNRLIEPKHIDAFCASMRKCLQRDDVGFRKAYLRLFLKRVEVGPSQVRLVGSKGTLEAGVLAETGADHDPESIEGAVPTFVRRWWKAEELNP